MKKYTIQSSIVDSKLNNRFPVVVGVSGGVDSMVLLSALIKANYTCIVCHVNHGLRPESDSEESFVRDYATNHQLTFETKKLDLRNAKNIQDAAHQQRIDFFKAVALKHQTHQIALAHHLDDQFEHHLIQLVRGTDLESWKGIQDVFFIENLIIVRPFIQLSKEEILNYADIENIAYMNDSSNQSDKYLRNRLRNKAIPLLKQENPNLLSNFLNNIKKLNEIMEDYSLKKLVNERPHKTINYLNFKDQNTVNQLKLLRYLIQLIDRQLYISTPQLKMIQKQLNQSGNNVRFYLKDNYWLTCNYGKIKVIKVAKPEPETITITGFGTYSYGLNKELVVSAEKMPYATKKMLEICYNKTTFPIIARPAKPGDKLTMDYGHKKVNRFFQDYKIPYHERIHQIILESPNRILGILSLGISNKNNDLIDQKIYIYEVDNA